MVWAGLGEKGLRKRDEQVGLQFNPFPGSSRERVNHTKAHDRWRKMTSTCEHSKIVCPHELEYLQLD